MTANHQSGHCALRLVFVAGIALVLSACVADDNQRLLQGDMRAMQLSATPGQGRHAIYKCGNDGAITVQMMANGVHLVDIEGVNYDLPASPPTQGNRFGEGNVALVVEGGEALWMKAGREPVTCQR